MRKYLAAAVLSAGLLVAGTATNPSASAQDKKTKVKEAPTSGGHIEIGKGKDGKYRFSVRDADEKYLGGSTVGHATEKECREAIETLQQAAYDRERLLGLEPPPLRGHRNDRQPTG